MSKILSLVAFAIIMAGCAGQATQTAASDEGAKEDRKSEVRCRYVKTTRSRLGEKVCEKVSK